MAIMFCIYTITLLLSLSMLKHPTYVSLSFHLRGVESESAGEFGRCREVLRGVVGGIECATGTLLLLLQ